MYDAEGQALVPTKDLAAGLRGVTGVDDMADALDRLGDRGECLGSNGPYGDKGGDEDALWRGEGREREPSGDKRVTTNYFDYFLLLTPTNKLSVLPLLLHLSLIHSMGVKGLWTLLGPVGRPVLYV